MKAIIISIIARVVVILGVLGFTFAMYYVTHNLNMLWLLWLLLCVWFIPKYEERPIQGQTMTKEHGNDD